MLDLLNTSQLEINVFVIRSAIRSCWGWGANQGLPSTFGTCSNKLMPNQTLSLSQPWSEPTRSRLWRTSGPRPKDAFAETSVAALLQQRFQHLRSVDAIVEILHHKPATRLEAATGALEDFEAAGVRVSGLCRRLKRSLHLLNYSNAWQGQQWWCHTCPHWSD